VIGYSVKAFCLVRVWRLGKRPCSYSRGRSCWGSGPPAFPDDPLRGPHTGKLLTSQRHASSAACPGRALPRHALLQSTAACCRRVLGEPLSPRGRGGGVKMPFEVLILSSGTPDGGSRRFGVHARPPGSAGERAKRSMAGPPFPLRVHCTTVSCRATRMEGMRV
jgi:hypothetical protein